MGENFFYAALMAILVPYSLVMFVLLWNEIGPSIRAHITRRRKPSSGS
jgi:hypothetical protein